MPNEYPLWSRRRRQHAAHKPQRVPHRPPEPPPGPHMMNLSQVMELFGESSPGGVFSLVQQKHLSPPSLCKFELEGQWHACTWWNRRQTLLEHSNWIQKMRNFKAQVEADRAHYSAEKNHSAV